MKVIFFLFSSFVQVLLKGIKLPSPKGVQLSHLLCLLSIEFVHTALLLPSQEKNLWKPIAELSENLFSTQTVMQFSQYKELFVWKYFKL